MLTTLQTRITLTMCLVGAMSAVTAIVATAFLLIVGQTNSVRQQLHTSAASLVSLGITDFSDLNDFQQLDSFIEKTLNLERVDKIIRVYDHKRKLIFSTVKLNDDNFPDLISDSKYPAFMSIEGKDRKYESLILPYKSQVGGKPFYLQIAIPYPKLSSVILSLWWQGLLMFSILLGASIIASRFLTNRLLKPVVDISQYLEAQNPDNIDAWVPLIINEKGQYLKAITEGINMLGKKMRDSILNLKRMSRYIAHELRNPLTIIQGEAETILKRKDVSTDELRSVVESSLEEVRRMADIVNTILNVADTSNIERAKLEFKVINLPEWILENMSNWEKTLGRKIASKINLKTNFEINTHFQLLHHLIDNLVRNVRVHSSAGADCFISFESPNDDVKFADLVIADNGIGMSKEAILSLNENGFRSEFAKVGLHLGFKIAKLLDIKMKFGNNDGGGLRVALSFLRHQN